jgi:hypothetical protein
MRTLEVSPDGADPMAAAPRPLSAQRSDSAALLCVALKIGDPGAIEHECEFRVHSWLLLVVSTSTRMGCAAGHHIGQMEPIAQTDPLLRRGDPLRETGTCAGLDQCCQTRT